MAISHERGTLVDQVATYIKVFPPSLQVAHKEGEHKAILRAEQEGRLPKGTAAAMAAGWV